MDNSTSGYMPNLAFVASHTPYVSRTIVLCVVNVPSDKPSVPKPKRIVPPNNTVHYPVDSGEHLFYHKNTGQFAPLPWNREPKHDIVLDDNEMQVARQAFRLRFPDQKYIGESHYAVDNDSFLN